MNDLVERLRYCQEHGLYAAQHDGRAATFGEAADRIEELEAAIKAERDNVVGYLRSFFEDGLADAIASGEHEVKG